ncbi:N-acetylneuraminate synthase family protein [Paenibacillus sp. FSL K6-1096]|uniref:N-acetylneuraminate synthase family protein n=1 Tax=Paenibacillus sp. FSL K6-1096 TaxID=2921460 RepID=UPI0030EDED26
MANVNVIAEIANAHMGDPGRLRELILAAAASGADGVKFQWFHYDSLATPDFSYYELYKDLAIDKQVWISSVQLARASGLKVWVDLYDEWGAELLAELADQVDGVKLPTTVLQSGSLIEALQHFGKPLIIGVGGWYEEELDDRLSYIRSHHEGPVILMHGFQGYPTDPRDSNLSRIAHLKHKYQLEVGFADHVDGDDPLAVDLPVYAYLLGADVIEKHITLNRAAKGTDYYSSLEPQEFKVMVEKLRRAEEVQGSLDIRESERKYLEDSTLRVVSGRDIRPGEIITAGNIRYKRSSVSEAFMAGEASASFPLIARSVIPANTPVTPVMVKTPKVCIAVICRLKSTRLRRKALLPVHGMASIERCLLNCLAIPGNYEVVLATSDLPEDEPLTKFTMNNRVRIVTGDPDNVAARLLSAAEATQSDIVVRVTGDTPAVSPEMMAYMIGQHLHTGADFTYAKESTVGTVGDVYTVEALRRLLGYSGSLTHAEYLSFYFMNNPELFRINNVAFPEEWVHPGWRLTLDEKQDLELLNHIYEALDIGARPLGFSELYEYLRIHPEVLELNRGIQLKWRDDTRLVQELNAATTLQKKQPPVNGASDDA